MKGFVGVTDNDWFAFFLHQPRIDEVNFWQRGGKTCEQSLNCEFSLYYVFTEKCFEEKLSS